MVEDFYEELQRLSHSLFAPLIVRSILRKTIALAIRSLDRSTQPTKTGSIAPDLP